MVFIIWNLQGTRPAAMGMMGCSSACKGYSLGASPAILPAARHRIRKTQAMAYCQLDGVAVTTLTGQRLFLTASASAIVQFATARRNPGSSCRPRSPSTPARLTAGGRPALPRRVRRARPTKTYGAIILQTCRATPASTSRWRRAPPPHLPLRLEWGVSMPSSLTSRPVDHPPRNAVEQANRKVDGRLPTSRGHER